ncbi:S41 family peptidase [Aureibacter tunicatorum]|uniref:C-terminal processing protease CtpA/Prc n=1 Tax=Aureibacter tunicatorum TaxID=866807 RepID=A0AAE4BQ57_9BACT|nr:S41 family peptidase [Aureibacter tunicatorum]MDR6238749.1 C-terminal processing protease CtpA/Prc [Aureibacter tunicatorum]BDD05320.1 peptidase S41 [Aureibacter tunicatorum]
MNKTLSLILILSLFIFQACNEQTNELDNQQPNTPSDEESIANRNSINLNIYGQMNDVYLWRTEMPLLSNLDTAQNPRSFFDHLIYKEDDRWSYITDEYQTFVNSLQGIEKSFGFQILPYLKASDSDEIIGEIAFVEPNTPASEVEIKRGERIVKVNGSTINRDNYIELLYETDPMNLTLQQVNAQGLVLSEREVSISGVELQSDPFLINKTIEYGGRKIGYLVFNSFIHETFDEKLQNIFDDFKGQGVTEFILDLRYNSGGSVKTANMLADLLAPSMYDGALFTQKIWNDRYNEYFIQEEGENSEALKDFISQNRNNLELSRLYIITDRYTASASELIINGLSPYLNVILVGRTTAGKYTASITLQNDVDENWAIQPIVYKSANALGNTDYGDGFIPLFEVRDDFQHQLGDPEEARLATALSDITGIAARKTFDQSTIRESLPIPKDDRMFDELK